MPRPRRKMIPLLSSGRPQQADRFLTVHPRIQGHSTRSSEQRQRPRAARIKLGPNYQNFNPLSAEAFRVFRRAEELGLPILLHQGDFAEPVRGPRFRPPPAHRPRRHGIPEPAHDLATRVTRGKSDSIAVIRNTQASLREFRRSSTGRGPTRMLSGWRVSGGLPKSCSLALHLPIATPQETMDALKVSQ